MAACLRFRPSRTSSASVCWHTAAPRLASLKRDLFPTSRLPPTLQTRLPFCSSLASPAHRRSTDRDGSSPGAPLLPPTQHLDSLGHPPPPPPASGASPPDWAGGAHGPRDRVRGLTCSAPASRRPAPAGGGLPLGARRRGVPRLAPRRGGGAEGGAAEVRLAEGGNGRDAITKPVRLGAGRTAPLWTEVALQDGGTWEGPRKPPRAAAPAGKTRESGPSRKAWHASWTLQNRAFCLRVRRCGAKGSRAPKSFGPNRVQRLAEAHASPMSLCPTANAIGLGLFTHCEGGKANREVPRENFCDSQKQFG